MAMIDPEQESQRLAEVYSSQSDGQLEQVAGQMSQLTDAAREALRAELTKRSLHAGELDEPTRKAEAGEFSLGPMLMALLGARNREKKRA